VRKKRPRVLENLLLRKMFGPKREEVTAEWKRLHKEELHDLFSTPNIIQLIERRRIRRRGMSNVWEAEEVYTRFWKTQA
jgi:hypothetical protein